MNTTIRYIIVGLSIVLGIVSVWYFKHLVAYILISSVLALIGRPLVDLLVRIHIRKLRISKSVASLITMLVFWIVFVAFFRIFIPLITTELNEFSNIDPERLLVAFADPIHRLETIVDKYQVDGNGEFTVSNFVTGKVGRLLNVDFLSSIFSTTAAALGNIFIALFSITFITFFFMKDEGLFREGLLMVVPDKYVENVIHAMSSTRHLLMRYFIGILFQITGIFTLVTIGMTIIGIEFSRSVLIGLVAGLFNVIPYLGPLLGGATGVLLGIATHLDMDFYTQLLPMVLFMIVVIAIVQLIDNFIFQPFIFSRGVNAHPLEIFLVIMMAGSLAGIPGMILAIPSYTVIRVFAKEFFNQFKVVKKLTQKIK